MSAQEKPEAFAAPVQPPPHEWLRCVREAAGMTRRQLAARVGESSLTIRNYEMGMSLSAQKRLRLVGTLIQEYPPAQTTVPRGMFD